MTIPISLTQEFILSRIEEMKKDRLAGNWPEDVETITQRLGYRNYRHYRQSGLWRKVIRPRILARDHHLCIRCQKKAKEIHHKHYTEAVMRGDDDSLLISLCELCHHTVEFDRNGKRRDIAEKLRVLLDNTAT